MDLSKLRKLSDTQSQMPPAPSITPSTTSPTTSPATPPVPVQHSYTDQAIDYGSPDYKPPGIGVEIWISVIIGVLLLMMGRSFGDWSIAKLRHQPYHTTFFWPDGAPYFAREVEYFELTGFTALSDMGIFLFGAMLLAEAAAKALLVFQPGKISRAFLWFAMLLTLAATLLNVYACLKLYNFGVIPAMSMLAVAFGGWILFDEWTTLQRTQPRPVAFSAA